VVNLVLTISTSEPGDTQVAQRSLVKVCDPFLCRRPFRHLAVADLGSPVFLASFPVSFPSDHDQDFLAAFRPAAVIAGLVALVSVQSVALSDEQRRNPVSSPCYQLFHPALFRSEVAVDEPALEFVASCFEHAVAVRV